MKFSPPRRRSLVSLSVFTAACALALAWALGGSRVERASAQPLPAPFKNFEAPQVHPLAITPDGTRLLALDTPEGRLSVFNLTSSGLTLAKEIAVGLEPVSVAARDNNEAWVVNWLSDSVSVVDLANGNVTRTFDVGDEPTDVLFTKNGALAFVCVSGLSQIKIFMGSSVTPSQTLNVRGKQPRSLARDTSGDRVFVSVFESGNQTTIVPEAQVRAGGGAPPPSPSLAAGLPSPPSTGLIVKWNGSQWADQRGDARWSNFTPYTLADVDLAVIDAGGAQAAIAEEIRGVGTNIGNAVYDPATDRLLVLNLEARNQVRFEPNLRGRFISNRLSTLDFKTAAHNTTALDLNPHINFSQPAGTDAERAKSLALPADIARSSDGTLYVAATGSNRVGVLSASGAVRARVAVGQGPTGLALDEARGRLYVLDRFENRLSVVDTRTRAEVSRLPLGFNAEPQLLRDGRRFLYDASLSAHGDVSCATCHLNGHRDGLAWDLGDPRGALQTVISGGIPSTFHPMKGPMTTQSLRGILPTLGLVLTGPLHWRGDRADLTAFNPAFTGLLGSPRQLNAVEMQAFTEFVRSLTYPSNPNENLDRTVANPPTGASALRGQQLYLSGRLDGGGADCNSCHGQASNGVASTGFIIPAALLQETQDFKIPQIRGLYQKLGLTRTSGEMLTGFGFTHDGSFATLMDFMRSPVFSFQNDNQRRDMVEFMLKFDTGTAPAVGLSLTVNGDNKTSPDTLARLELLMQQCAGVACDLVARGVSNNQRRGFLFVGNRTFRSDRQGEPNVSLDSLLQSAGANSELTFLGVPDGAGSRLSIDRDADTILDADDQAETLSIAGQITGASGNPVANVAVSLSGTQSLNTQTDAQGRYSFAGLPGGAYTVAPAGSSFSPAAQSFGGSSGALTANFTLPADVRFASATFSANEGAGAGVVTITRAGDTSGATTVELFTVDNLAAVRCDDLTSAPGTAFARCDYATTVETLRFNAGETSKTVNVPLVDDAHAETDETVALKLGEVAGGSLGASGTTATLTIHDNDSAPSGANPILSTPLFIRMQYLDFLSREPEGGEPWSAVLNNCPAGDTTCDRIRVSSAFFLSQEFQLKGLFVFKFYKAAFGRLPRYVEIIPDMRSVTGVSTEEVTQKRNDFTAAWVERPEFVAKYPLMLSETEYVDRLLQTAGVTLTGATTRDTLVADLRSGAKSRADVVRAVVESSAVNEKEFNSAFVAMQYFGYLRRDPEEGGYNDWLRTINANPNDSRSMVNGFMNSEEYKLRFGRQ